MDLRDARKNRVVLHPLRRRMMATVDNLAAFVVRLLILAGFLEG